MQIIQTKDYETIARLNKDVHELHFNLYPEIFKEYNYKAIKEFLKQYSENEFRRTYKSVYLHQLCIIEEERNKGFGGKLMEKVTEIAETNHIRKIELDYWHNNDMAKDFYNKNGYKKYREFVYKEI